MQIKAVPSAYSPGQLQAYLDRIEWTGSAPKPDLVSLKRLMQLHLQTIPFSNTFIHYEDGEPAGIEPYAQYPQEAQQQFLRIDT